MNVKTLAQPRVSQIPEPTIARLLFADTRLAPVWLSGQRCYAVSGCAG